MPIFDRLAKTLGLWRTGRQARSGPTPAAAERQPPLRLEALEDRTLLSAGTGLTAEYFGDKAMTKLLMTRTDPTINLNLSATQPPAAGLPATGYAIRWTGQVQATQTAAYTFSTMSDDGVRLTVNGQTLINDWTDHAPRQGNGTIQLVAGQKYSIQMDYYQNAGGAVAQLFWSNPQTAKQLVPTGQLYAAKPVGAGTCLTGSYYRDTTLTSLVASRTDAQVNFAWANGAAPLAGMPTQNWSARWVGTVQATYTGTYTFYTTSDDGVRLTVNGQRLVDNWTIHAPTENSGAIYLVAGQRYTLQMDYFQGGGGAAAQLRWSGPATPKQLIPRSQLYPGVAAGTPPAAPTAQVAVGGVTSTGTTHTFTVTYRDDAGINAATIDSADIRVVGPNGYSQLATLVNVNTTGNGTPRTATYRINAPGGAWDSVDNGTYTVSMVGLQVRDISGLAVPAQTLGAFQVNVAADWFARLVDPTLRTLARTYYVGDRQLGRTDMIGLFNQAAQDNVVTTSELNDLRTLVGNAGAVGMPDYVRNLANKVVNGDPANNYFQGRWVGNLVAGNTGGTLRTLVQEWFFGLDRPTTAAGVTYAAAAGTLYGSAPSYLDVHQGAAADCYFLAGLAETVLKSSATIRSMFIDNADGTFTVRFYKNGVADYVTVDRQLPSSGGSFYYANAGAALSNPANKLWVALAEKAYAQLAESGWSRAATANAYTSINIGWEGTALYHITGRGATSHQIVNTGATLSTLVSAFNAGRWIGLDSRDATASGIVANHVYVMLGYNSSTGVFRVYNPWGYEQQLTWAQVAGNFSHWSQA